MAFVSLSELTGKVDVPRRTVLGRKSHALPETGLEEHVITLPSCAGCSKLAAHAPCRYLGIRVPHGETRYERVPEANRFTVEDLEVLQAALHLLGYIAHGYIGNEFLFNAGWGGNNASQTAAYEIVSASGTTLRLRGPNPKALQVGSFRLNPEWPGADPVTGSPARLISETGAICLPPGAQVEFSYPSALHAKCRPMVVAVEPPASDDLDDVEFDVTLNQSVDFADTPVDLAYPPEDGVYLCAVRFEAIDKADWRNFQRPRESSFSPVELSITEASVVTLKNSAAADTRVLYPGWFDGSFTVVQENQDASSAPWTEEQIREVLTTTQTGEGAWTVTFDASGVDFVTAVESLELRYHAESVEADEVRVMFAASCSNAQREATGSYAHSNGELCTRIASDQFGSFEAGCWQPECDGFSLGDVTEGFGNKELAPADVGDEAWWSSLWYRGSWLLVQGLPGLSSSRNFAFVRPSPAGPSIGVTSGNWRRYSSGTYVELRREHHGPRWGKRVTWTDGDDNQHQRLVHGAFYLEAYDEGESDGPANDWEAGTTPTQGVVAEQVGGWYVKEDALGGTMTDELARLPERLTGWMNTYSYACGGSSMAAGNEWWPRSELWVTGADLSVEDEDFAAQIRGRFT